MNEVLNILKRLDYSKIYAVTCYALILLIAIAHVAMITDVLQSVMHIASVCICIGYGLFAYTLKPASIGKALLVIAAFTTLFWI